MSGTQKALTPATIPPFIRDHAVELVEKLLGRAQAKFESYDAMLESYHAGRVVQLPRGPLPLMGKRDEALLDAQAFRSILELLEDARPEHEKATIAAFEALPMTRSGARVIA